MRKRSSSPLPAVMSARGDLENIRRTEASHIMSSSDAEMDEFELHVARKREHLNDRLAAYEKLLADEEDRRRLRKAQADVAAYLALWNKLQEVSRQTATDPTAFEQARVIFMTDGLKAFDAALLSLNELWSYNETLGKTKMEEAGAAST